MYLWSCTKTRRLSEIKFSSVREVMFTWSSDIYVWAECMLQVFAKGEQIVVRELHIGLT